MENIILASQSPRRQEILSLGGYEYKVCVSSAEEQIPPEELENLTPQELVEKSGACESGRCVPQKLQ